MIWAQNVYEKIFFLNDIKKPLKQKMRPFEVLKKTKP